MSQVTVELSKGDCLYFPIAYKGCIKIYRISRLTDALYICINAHDHTDKQSFYKHSLSKKRDAGFGFSYSNERAYLTYGEANAELDRKDWNENKRREIAAWVKSATIEELKAVQALRSELETAKAVGVSV